MTAAVVRCLRFLAPGVPCPTPADGVIGIELYPFASLMQLRGLTTPLTRMILNMPVCQQHREEFVVDDVLTPEALAAIIRQIEHETHVMVDPKGAKITRVAFDDRDYLMLERARRGAERDALLHRFRQPHPGETPMHRRLTNHHDGHGLNESEAAVLAILIDRLEGFQAGPYACAENAEQLEHLRAALRLTHERAHRRAAAGTLGTMEPEKP